jgi:4-amino-4-deoxy-L-arabinose transferase-like glycosyltransferase
MAKRDSVLIFLIGLIAFTIGLSPEFLGLDARFGVFAQEMLRNGPTFFPTTYGQPYPDYPAASTFMIYLASLPFGKVTPFSAVLPVAAVSALILVVTYRIGAIHSRRWGLCAVVLALFTKEFFSLSRSLSPDQYVSLATALSFYLAYSADTYGRQKRLWFIPLILAAGFAFRGPIGLVIPAGVLCGYYLYGKDFKKFALTAVVSLIVLAVCGSGLLAAADYQGGEAFVKRVIGSQAVGRIQREQHKFLYYWYQSFTKYAIVYPFAVVVIVARFKQIFKRENSNYKFMGYLVIWIFIVLFGMSIPGAKKIRYIVPMVPAAALIASYIFVEPLQNGFLTAVKKIFLGFCAWFPAGAFVAVSILWIVVKRQGLSWHAYYVPSLIWMFVLAGAGQWLDRKLRDGYLHQMVLTSIGAATFIIIVIGIEEPISYTRDSTGPFVQKVEALQKQKPGELVFYKISRDGEAIKFMVNLDKPVTPQFVKSPDALLGVKEPAYFIAMKKDFNALPDDVAQRVKIVASGTISHEDTVVFTLPD